jgi:microfibrillar-associated protein 1
MQKYYHKGAFGTGDDKIEIALDKTDGGAPTLEDHFDYTSLPQVMQVKNFGLRGRTKYTHLTDQDTTEHGKNSAWNKKEGVPQSVLKKMGGMQKGFANPAAKKQKTADK